MSARGSAQRRVEAKFTSASNLYLSPVQLPRARQTRTADCSAVGVEMLAMSLLLLLVMRSPADG